MSSPVVERVRTVPLVFEQDIHIPMEVDESSGFPFERDPDRDGHFRSQLDDIAKRHPEFAEHLGNFSLGSSPRRRSSGSEDDHLRRFERPFRGRFERFGFPFDRDDFDPEKYAQQFYQPHQEYHQQSSHQPQQHYQQQQYSQAQPQPQPEYRQSHSQEETSQPQSTVNPPPTTEREKNNIQQSNTIDLGQKQEPVNERNQRSMSAPPGEKAQRFTSSINIPVNQPTETENMAQPQTQSQSDSKTTERIIPIHIEGRDEPVLPRNIPPSYSSQAHHTQGPQAERIFGHRPEHFTQFVNREPRQFDNWHQQFEPMHGFEPEEPLRQQRYHPQQNTPPHYQQQQRPPQYHQQPKEDIQIPVQRDVPQTKPPQQPHAPQSKQQAPEQPPAAPQEPEAKPAPQQQKPLTPIDQIQAIQKDVSALLEQVEKFTGKPKDKLYLYLDEMLTRNLLKLDNVDTQGQETIRSARKEAIKCIERAIGVLEAKAAAGVQSKPKEEDKMDIDEKSQDAISPKVDESTENKGNFETMETEPAVNTEQQTEVVPEKPNDEPAIQVEQKEVKPNSEETKVEEQAEPAPTEENKSEPHVETRAVLVEKKPEPVENKESCEGQESNLPVAEAVKKFEGSADSEDGKKEESSSEVKPEEKNETDKQGDENKPEVKKEEKKEKKKGKKKAEKKEQ